MALIIELYIRYGSHFRNPRKILFTSATPGFWLVLLHRSSEDQTTTLPDGELTNTSISCSVHGRC